MNQQLHPIVVDNPAFGKSNGATIYASDELRARLQGEGFKGVTLDKLSAGRAFRGFKHLIEMVTGEDGRLVLTFEDTQKNGDFYYVNLEEYMKISDTRFYDMYRDVGLTVSSTFLGEHFPSDFDVQDRQELRNQVNQAQQNLKPLLESLAQKPGNHPALVNGILSVLRAVSGKRRLPRELTETLERLQTTSNLVGYTRVVDQLEARLKSRRGYAEAGGDDSWQKWIYRNSWLFGPMYLEPIQWQSVGFRSKPDFLFPTLDGFLDILEIKLPTADVIREVGRHHAWSDATNRAIGQVVAYIEDADMNRPALERDINDNYTGQLGLRVTASRPRAFILIGRDTHWRERQREAYRTLNYSLHGVEIVTYDELLRRGRKIIELYSQAPSLMTADG